MNFVKNLNSFFKKNWVKISFVVVALFLILAIVALQNIEFKRHPDKTLEKIILYEKFRGREGMKPLKEASKAEKKAEESPTGSPDIAAASDPKFCNRTTFDMERACGDLDKDDCKTTDCCIWAKPQDNDERCMVGNQNGASYNSHKKSLDWWWYKGKNKEAAIKYDGGSTKDSENFKEDDQEPIEGREPLEDTEAALHQEEKEEEEKDDAIDTIEQKVAIDMNDERAERMLLQEQARKKLKQQQDFVNELATLRDSQKAKKVAADTEEQTVQALKIVANEKKLEMEEDELDKLKLQQAINQTTAEDEGDGVSSTDKTNLAEGRIEIEAKKRELGKLANEAKQQSQGELVGGEKINGTNRVKALAGKVTPGSIGPGVEDKKLLAGIKKLMKKSELMGDGVGKISGGLSSGVSNVALEAFAGMARSGLTNYFR